MAEWASAGDTGLGVLINIANQGLFDTPLMFVALAALAIIGLAFYGGVVVVERRLVASERTTDALFPRPAHPARRLVLLAACSSPVPTGTASVGEPLRAVTLLLGFRPDVQFAPFYVAQQEGFYADAGLEVTIEHDQAPDVQRLVADGQAEFGVADATDVMIARTVGHPDPLRLDALPELPGRADRRGGDGACRSGGPRRDAIGTPGQFGSSWHALLALLDAGGLTADDITVREYPQFNQVDGLANGDVDLITGFRNNEPLQLEDRGMTVDLLTVDDIAPLPGPGMIVGDELLASDPELVRAFVEATAAAQAAVIDDPDLGFAAAEVAVPAIAREPRRRARGPRRDRRAVGGRGVRERGDRRGAVGDRLRDDAAPRLHRRVGARSRR